MRAKRFLHSPFEFQLDQLRSISNEVRRGVFEICLNAQSGHLGGSSSSVELVVALYFGGILRFDPLDPKNPLRDRVLVRGHLGPLRYKIFSLLGWVGENELFSYRTFGSRLQGHEDHEVLSGVDFTPSGSLGMLLSYGVGCSVVAKESSNGLRVFVFLGDGEEQEGNVSEAARHAAYLRLGSLLVVMDKNGKQLSNPIRETDSSNLKKIWEGYGWKVLEIKNGHNLEEILTVYKKAITMKMPTMVIANTVKGLGLEGAENHFSGYHTISVCSREVVGKGIEDLHHVSLPFFPKRQARTLKKKAEQASCRDHFELSIPIESNETNSKNLDACQAEYFLRLWEHLTKKRFKFPIFFLTADVTRQDHVELLKLRENTKFFNVGIREQHMLAMAHGISLTDPSARIIINSFDAFSYRSLDQLNAMVQGGGNALIIGDVSGVTNAKNGKTHQTAGHPGALLTIPHLTFLEPGDSRDLFNCFNWAIGRNGGVTYIRIHSSDVEPFCRSDKDLWNIDHYIVYETDIAPQVLIVASGLTIMPSIQAAIELTKVGIPTRVVNVINQKSLGDSFVDSVPPRCFLLTVYNGLPEILFNSVASAIIRSGRNSVKKALSHGFYVGTSGSLPDIMRHFNLDKEGIIALVKRCF